MLLVLLNKTSFLLLSKRPRKTIWAVKNKTKTDPEEVELDVEEPEEEVAEEPKELKELTKTRHLTYRGLDWCCQRF